MRIISQDKKYDLPYENYGFMINGSGIRDIGRKRCGSKQWRDIGDNRRDRLQHGAGAWCRE